MGPLPTEWYEARVREVCACGFCHGVTEAARPPGSARGGWRLPPPSRWKQERPGVPDLPPVESPPGGRSSALLGLRFNCHLKHPNSL